MTDCCGTKVYAANVQIFRDPDLYQTAYELAGAQRRDKTDHCRVMKDKYLSLGTELLLRHALMERGLDTDTALAYEDHGKPYLINRQVKFNFSHSHDYALCAVSDFEIGCDIEKTGPAKMAVAKRFFTETEYQKLASITDQEEQRECFYRFWTLKESFLKVTGYGMRLPLNEFEVFLDEEITVRHNLKEQTYQFIEYNNIPGYRCAVCIAGKDSKIQFQELEIQELLTEE